MMQQPDVDSTSSSSSSWQAMGKSDSASDGGDDASSIKSGSTITNATSQSHDSSGASNSGTQLQSSPWNTSTATLSSIDSSPWNNSSSSFASAFGSVGWSSNSSSLSLGVNNQGHNTGLQSGSGIIGNSSAFSSVNSVSTSSGWPASLAGNGLVGSSSLSQGLSSGLQGNSLSFQVQNSTMLGNIGDFSKNADSAWSNPMSLLDSGKDLVGASSDPRMWGLSSDKPGESQWDASKSQWRGSALGAGNDQGTSNTELSFAQATLKGLKLPPATNAPQIVMNSRHEEILRAIENHEGWGSRPIRQDTSWDVDGSPKSHRKFTTEPNAGASNVWNNSNGTAIWEAVRENQSSGWTGAAAAPVGGNSWNAEKEQASWVGPPKPSPQDSSTYGDTKAFGTWGATGAAGDASNKMWGQKTEVGSWGVEGGGGGGVVQRTTSIPPWGDDGDSGSWDDQRRIASMQQVLVPPSPGIGSPAGIPGMVPQGMPGMNTAVGLGPDASSWNDLQKPGWNSAGTAAALSRTSLDEPWNKPPPTRSGWGDPTQDGVDVDNGTGVWASSTPKQPPPQAKAPSWTDVGPQQAAQWNAVVGTKPKIPGWDEASWALAQRTKCERYPPEECPGSSVEVGYWNGLPQDTSSWNDPAALRGVRKITGQQVPQKFVPTGGHPPTQMRAKLLQHLMDMGFRKEEAQNALITNNLNLELAINDLKAANSVMPRKELEMDIFHNGPQSRIAYISKGGGLGSEDVADMRSDQVPPFSAAHMPSQPFMQGNTSMPPSSLNPNNSSINPSLQQKLMQKMQQQQAPPNMVQRSPMPPPSSSSSNSGGGGGTNSQVPQQQQQILSQLRQAVNNGFISSQLLNYQLPHNILVLLQQLLQHQSALQNAISRLQQARAAGNRNNPQLEQLPGIISNINQQIISLQKQLQQAQNNLLSSQKPPGMAQANSGVAPPQASSNMADNLDALSSDLANVALQTQSRLATQWKPAVDPSVAVTTDLSLGMNTQAAVSKSSDENNENKLLGLKAVQSLSSPSLGLIPGGLGMSGDKTWSSSMSATSSSNWPLSSDNTISTQADHKTSTSSSLLSGLPSGLTDVIPEFVPGKPWQGLAKNVEDDPHVTPGSIQQHLSLSVNRVHDESLNNLDGHKLSSSNSASWGNSMKATDSLGLSQLGSRPPPSMMVNKSGAAGQQWQQQQQQQQAGNNFNRQTSWPHSTNSAFTKVSGSGWNDSTSNISSWILLKNLTVDPNTVRALCAQHGSVISFYPLLQGQLALVQYSSREVCFAAQQRLNNFHMGSTAITVEFVSEADAQRLTSQIPPPPQPTTLPPINTSPWSQAPPAPFQNTGMRGGDPWSGSMLAAQSTSRYGSASDNPWGLWDRTEHGSNPLSNILGGESM